MRLHHTIWDKDSVTCPHSSVQLFCVRGGPISEFMKAVCEATRAAPKMFPKEDTGYVTTFVGRKVVLARLAGGLSVDWANISRQDLQDLSCDQSGSFNAFDPKLSAAVISDFVFRRPDWGRFVSLFSCLWQNGLPDAGKARETLMRDIQSGAFEKAAAALWTSLGHAAHPALVVQKLSGSA